MLLGLLLFPVIGTAQTVVTSYTDDFQSYGTQANPAGWVDTSVGNPKPTAAGLYKTWPDPLVSGNVVYGTKQASGKPEGNNPRIGTFSTYTTKSFSSNGRFEYRGRFLRTTANARVGLTFFSGYPETDRYYLLGLWSQSGTATLTMQLFGFGGATPTGTVDSKFTPDVNKWYAFHILCDDVNGVTSVRARIWLDTNTEPTAWIIDATDNSAGRLTSGRIGIWGAVRGDAYYDDLVAKSPVDHTAPVIDILVNNVSMTEGQKFNVAPKPKIVVTDDTAAKPNYTALLDGVAFVSETAVTGQGNHTLTVHAVDDVGNTADLTRHFYVDTIPPVVNVISPKPDSASGDNVVINVQVTDASMPATTTAMLDGAPWNPATPVSAEGKHVLALHVTDAVGLFTDVPPITFWVDKTAPSYTLKNGAQPWPADDPHIFDSDVTINIDVVDLTPLPPSLTLDGAPYTPGTLVSAEGAHVIAGTVSDRVGHVTTVVPRHFIIDKSAPVVTITDDGQPLKTYYETGVKPAIAVFDVTTTTLDATLNGQPFQFGATLTNEGRYELAGTVTDAVHHQTKFGPIVFFVDRSAPVVALTANDLPFPLSQQVFPSDVTLKASITDLTPVDSVVKVDDVAVTLPLTLSADATHTVVVTATDALAHTTKSGPYSFTIDKTPPVVTVTVNGSPLVSGTYFNAPVSPVINVEDATSVTRNITLDGAPYNSGTPISAEGKHVLAGSVSDAGQHTVQVGPYDLFIDTTAPTGVFMDGDQPFPNGQSVNRTVTARVQITDANPDPTKTAILLDGKPYVAGDAITAEGLHSLTATIADKAGDSGTVPGVTVRIDRTPPVVTVLANNAPVDATTKPFGVDVTVTATAADDPSQPVAIQGTLDNAQAALPVVVSTDGPHTFSATGTDAAGNTSQPVSISFLVEKTPAKVAVLENGKPAVANAAFNVDVAVTLQIDSGYTPRTAVVTLNGNPYTPGTPITAEGSYTIGGTVTTGSGVVTQIPATSFVIDRTPPTVSVYDGSAPLANDAYFNRTVTPVIKVEDKTATTTSATLDGAAFTSGTDVTAAGAHVLAGSVSDAAGNSTPVGQLTFHIDRTAPVAKFMEGDHDFPDGQYVARDVTAHVVVTDDSPFTTEAKLDGNAYKENDPITEEGTHTVSALVTDRAGNATNVTPVTVHIDRTPPDVKLLADGNDFPAGHAFSKDVVADVRVIDASPYATSGTLDGNPITFPVTISAEGHHTISATANDAAGNTKTTAPIDFTVDKTPRSVTVLENGQDAIANAIFGVDVVVTLRVTDGASGYTANITLDGAPYTAGTPITTEAKTHTIAGTVTSGSGISSDIPVTTFTIDKTPPTFTLKNRTAPFPPNGAYLNTDVVPSAECADALTDCTPKLTLDGAAWTNNTAITTEVPQPHALVVTAIDAAGNTAPPQTFTFVIDKHAPSGVFKEGDADFPAGKTLNRNVSARVVVADTNPDPSHTVILLNGQPYVENTPITAEGDYTLTATVFDLAGNSAPVAPVSFRIDKTPPVLAIVAGTKELANDDAFSTDVVLDARVTDNSTTTVTGTLDGAPVTFPVTVKNEAVHSISALATDAAGNSTPAGPLSFILEKTPPVVKVLENGTPATSNKAWNVDVAVTLDIDTGLTARTASITIDGNAYTAGTAITAEGRHDVAGVVTTRSGLTTNIPPVSFIIDRTPPSVTLRNGTTDFPENGHFFNTDVVPVVTCSDNLTQCTPKLMLDGAEIANHQAIAAEGAHTLVASATDEAGNTKTLDPVTFTIDKTAPILTVTSHTDGQVISTPTVVLEGGSDDAVLVTANSLAATVDVAAKHYTTPAIPLTEGDNTIALVGIDQAGNAGSKAIHIIVDTRAPELVIRTPQQNACVSDDSIVISGVSTDPNLQAVKVTLGDKVVDNALDASKQSWSATFTGVAEGPQTATVESTDTFGHKSIAQVRFLADRTAPSIEVTESGVPFVPRAVNHPLALLIRAKDLDANVHLTMTLDGQPFVSGTLLSAERAYHIDVSAADCAGHQSALPLDFSIDLHAPVFNGLTPASGATISSTPTTITGNANELAHIEIEGTVIAADTAANGDFTLAGVPFADGVNSFVLRATDRAGNVARFDYSVTIKAAGPNVHILENGTDLADGKVFNRPVSPVVTTDDPTATITALLDNQTYDGKPVTGDKQYVIEGRATDRFNRTATLSRTFSIDMTPPAITITSPQAGPVTTPRVTVTGSAGDAVDVTVNGVTAQLSGGTYSAANIPLDLGENTIVAVGRDAAGNTGRAEIVVTLTGTGPGIIITEPAEGLLTNRPRVDVAGRVLSAPKNGTVTVGSRSVAVDSVGAFRLSDYQLTEGDNTITVTAQNDNATNSATVHVTADFTRPALSVLANNNPFADNAQFPSAVTLSITASDLHATKLTTALTVDGVRQTPPVSITKEGGHNLIATARDDAGNETRIDRTFFIGNSASAAAGCSIASTDPGKNAVVTTTNVTIAGRAPNAVSVTVEGRPADVSDNTFRSTIDLPNEGANTLTIRCTDALGVAGDPFTLTLTRVTGAPSIHITSPAEGFVTNAKSVTVSGTVGSDVVSADVNGIAATISNGTFSAANVGLSNGLNVIVAHARNAAQRAGTDSIRVRSIQAAPVIEITSPLADYQTGATSVTVSGTYTNINPATLAVAGANPLNITPSFVRVSDTTGTFIFPNVPLVSAAANTITVSGKSILNEPASATVKVTTLVNAPWIAIAQPLDNAYLKGDQQIAVSGTFAAGGGSANIDVNGGAATVDYAGSTYTGSAAFGAGTILPVVARMTAGADSAIAAVRVNKVSGPLTVLETFPAANAQAVDPSVVVLVSFSSPVDPTTLSGITLSAPDGTHVSATTLVDDKIVSFAPTALLGSGTTYTIGIASTVKDIAGNAIDKAYSVPFTTSVSAPSAAPAIDPVSVSGCVTQLDITGTAPAQARLRLDTAGITLSATADATGKYKFPFPLSGQSGWQVARVRIVGPDGSLSPEASTSFRIDCAGPHVVTASYDATVNKLTIIFSKTVKSDTLAVGAASSIRITLSDGSSIGGDVSLAGNIATVTPSSDLSARSFILNVTTDVADDAGNHLAPQFAQTFNNGGSAPADGAGFITGEVYDATTGRPLPGAQVTVIVPATAFARTGSNAIGRSITIGSTGVGQALSLSGQAQSLSYTRRPRAGVNAEVALTQVADTRGRYTIQLPEGAHTIEVNAAGYSSVWRQIVVPAGAGVVPIDIRLTPRGTSKTSDGTTSIAMTNGGANVLTRPASLTVPAGAIPSGSKVALTAIGAQSLAGLLPLGWSPLASVEIAVSDSADHAVADASLGNAQLSFTLPSSDVAAANQVLSFVQYDADRDEWRTLVPVMTAGADGKWTVPVTTVGAYAVVYADRAAGLVPPPAASGGATLQAATGTCVTSDTPCTLTKKRFDFDQPTVTPSGRAIATLQINGSTSAPFPSGTAVQAYVSETLTLSGGGTVIDPPFSADLLLYRALDGSTGESLFTIAPSAQAAQVVLSSGVDHIEIQQYPGRLDRGTLIGTEGGRVPGDPNVAVEVPSGATNNTLHTSVTTVPQDALATHIDGFTVVGGFDLAMTRADAPAPIDLDGDGQPDPLPAVQLTRAARATVAIDTTKLPAPNAQLILVEALDDATWKRVYRLAARMQAIDTAAAGVTTIRYTTRTIDPSDLPLDGVVREGRYLVLAANSPVAFATGALARAVGGPYIGGGLITSLTATAPIGVADVTRNTGVFAVPIAAAGSSVVPSVAGSGAGAASNIGAQAADAVVKLGDVVFTIQPPHVTGTSPLDNATIDASQPLVITVSFDANLDATSASSAIVVTNATSGTAVAGTASIAGSVLSFTPSDAIIAGTHYSVLVKSSLRGSNGAPFGRNYNFGFQTQPIVAGTGGVNPLLFHITIPDDNGISRVYGDAGAVPANWRIVLTRADHDFIQRYQATATANGFEVMIGGGAPQDRITLEDVIDARVLNPAGNVATIVHLTPFVTADGRGFIAEPGVANTFVSVDGLGVTVPAGAFDEPTLITTSIAPNTDEFLVVPDVTGELNLHKAFKLNFDGVSHERIDVSIPMPAGLPTDRQYVLGWLGQSTQGPRVAIVDTMRIDGANVTTSYPPQTTGGGSLKKISNAGLTDMQIKSCVIGVTRQGSYALADLSVGSPVSGWAIFEGIRMDVEMHNSTYHSLYLPDFTFGTRAGCNAMPVRKDTPFTVTGYDAATGLQAFQKEYAKIALNDPDVVPLANPAPDKNGPYPIYGTPFTIETVVPVADTTYRRGYKITKQTNGGFLLENDPSAPAADKLQPDQSFMVFDLTKGLVAPVKHVTNANAVSFNLQTAEKGDQLMIVQGATDVDPDTRLSVVFSEPIDIGQIPQGATGQQRIDAITANMRSVVKVEEIVNSIPNDITNQIVFDADSQNRRLLLTTPSKLLEGATYRLTLSVSITDTQGNPLGQVTDKNGSPIGNGGKVPFVLEAKVRPTVDSPLTSFKLNPAAIYSSASLKDLTRVGNLAFVAALDGGLLAYDMSNPGALKADQNGNNPLPMALVPAKWLGTLGGFGMNEFWAVTADLHGRVWGTGVSNIFAEVHEYKVEDFLHARDNDDPAMCAGFNGTAPNAVCRQHGGAVLAWRPGYAMSQPLSSNMILTDQPEAYPRRMQLIEQDQKTTYDGLAKLEADASLQVQNKRFLPDNSFMVDVHVPYPKAGNGQDQPLVQRVTVYNADLELSFSGDALMDEGVTIKDVVTRKDDRLVVIKNTMTYGVVALIGFGVGVFDLNAIESNDFGQRCNGQFATDHQVGCNNASGHRRFPETILQTPADKQSSCDSLQLADPAIVNLFGSAEESGIIEPTSPDTLHGFGLDPRQGVLDYQFTLPTAGNTILGDLLTGRRCITRPADGLMLKNNDRLSAIKAKANPPRFNGLTQFVWHVDAADNNAGLRGSAPKTTVDRTYMLVPGGSWGLLVLEVGGTKPQGSDANFPYYPLQQQHLVDVIWTPAGAFGVRLVAPTTAAVVDGKGRLLLVDLSNIDERWKPRPDPTQEPHFNSGPFDIPTNAMYGTAASPDELGAADPRIIYTSPYPVTSGTLPPLFDPETGLAFGGNINSPDMRVAAATDPRIDFLVDVGNGMQPATGVVPLGIDPKTAVKSGTSAAAFRVRVTLPGAMTEALAGNTLRLAIESERVPNAIAAQTPAPLPRAHLRQKDRTGTNDNRNADIAMQHAIPKPATMSMDDYVKKYRHQEGFNQFLSPWIVAIADPRAALAYQPWPGNVTTAAQKADAGCNSCDRPTTLENKTEAQGVFEIYSAGRFFHVRPEVDGAGFSIFNATPYDYLSKANRLSASVGTTIADTIRPTEVVLPGLNPPVVSGAMQETYFAHSGELQTSHVDLNTGGRAGVNVAFDRTYRSRTLGFTQLGWGWDSVNFQRLRPLPNGSIEYRDGVGNVWKFGKPQSTAPNTYTAPAGCYLKLNATQGGWMVTDAQWNATYFDAYGRVVRFNDRFVDSDPKKGNSLNFSYDSQDRLSFIADPYNRVTQLEYWTDADAQQQNAAQVGASSGKLRRITDWRQRKVEYQYATDGTLTTVKLPEVTGDQNLGANYTFTESNNKRPRVQYAYDTAAGSGNMADTIELRTNLLSIKDPVQVNASGDVRVKFAYDQANRDRIGSETASLPECSNGSCGVVKFTYPAANQMNVVDLLEQERLFETTLTTLYDKRAHLFKVTVKNVPHVTAVDTDLSGSDRAKINEQIAADALVTQYQYDDEGEIKRIETPFGLTTEITPEPVTAGAGSAVQVPAHERTKTITETGSGNVITTQYTYPTALRALTFVKSITRSDTAGGATVTRDVPVPQLNAMQTTVTDEDVEIKTDHDDFGRPHTVQRSAPGAAATQTSKTDYHDDGNVSAVSFGLPKHTEAGGQNDGLSTDISYTQRNDGGYESTATDNERGDQTIETYDSWDRVIRRRVNDNAKGLLTDERFGYDATGRMTIHTRKQKGVGSDDIVTETYTFDIGGRRTDTSMNRAQVDGSEQTVHTHTDYQLSLHTIIDFDPYVSAQGIATITKTDRLGRVEQLNRGLPGSTISSKFGYDRHGELAYQTDGVRMAALTQRDAFGRVTMTLRNDGTRDKTTWDAWSQATEFVAESAPPPGGSREELGRSRVTYTNYGRRRATSEHVDGPTNRVTRFDLSPSGLTEIARVGEKATASIDLDPNAMLRTVRTQRDSAGRILSRLVGEGRLPNLDPADTYAEIDFTAYRGTLPVSITRKEPRAAATYNTSIVLDAIGRTRELHEANGSYVTTYDYDEAGHVTSVSPPGYPSSWQSHYDSRGLLTLEEAPESTNITRKYDERGLLRLYQDEDGKETKYDTDPLGRVTLITYPDQSTEQTVYEDVTGLVAAHKDRKDQWMSYFYDANGRLTDVRLGGPRAADPTAPLVGNPYLRYTYDLGGRLTEEASRDGATQYADFDYLGRPATTHTIRYGDHSGLGGAPAIVDTHTQQHDWSFFDGERDHWRMPAAGSAAPNGNPSSGWRSWIIEERDAVGNLERLSHGNDGSGTSNGTIVSGSGRGAGRLITRTRFYGNAGNALDQNYGYADGQQGSSGSGLPTPAPGPVSGLLGRSQIAFGSYTMAGGQIERDAARRATIRTSLGIADRQTDWSYDNRGRLKVWSLDHAPGNSVAFTSDTLIHADFRQSRSVTNDPRDASELGSLASKYALPSWTASKTPLHQYLERALSNETTARTYAFDQAGRRTSDGRWTSEFDEGGHLSAIHRGDQRIEYTYNAQGRLIGRRALHEISAGQFVLEDRSQILDPDHLPADTTWVWDPISDRLVAIFEAGKSIGASDPEAGLVRQFVHGDQGYDDPVEVTIKDKAASPVRYLPLVDESGSGSVEAVVGSNGLLAERVLYGDAYGDSPRYLTGAVVDKIEVEPSKRGDGSIDKVTVRVHLSETVDQTTLQNGLRIAAVNTTNQVVATASPDITASGGTITAVLDATQWSIVTGANGATHLEIAVTNQLRAALWTGPVMPLAEWLLDGPGRASNAQFPVIQRESFASLSVLIAGIPPGGSKSETLLAIHNLYLVAANESKTNTLLGFKAGVTDPRTGLVYFRNRWYAPGDGQWLQPDDAGYRDSSSLYSYCGASPVECQDPLGLSVTSSAVKAALRDTAVGGAFGGGLGALSRIPKVGGGLATGVGIGVLANSTINATASRIDQLSDEGDFSYWDAFQFAAGDVTGVNAIGEAITGLDLVTGRRLTDDEHGERIGSAIGVGTGFIAGGLAYSRGAAFTEYIRSNFQITFRPPLPVSIGGLDPGMVRIVRRNAGIPQVLRSAEMKTLDLAGDWRATKFEGGQEGLMYVLRDMDSSEALKVGKTEVENFIDRFRHYENAGDLTGRHLALDVFSIDKVSEYSLEAIEKQFRAHFESMGHSLPWDNTSNRLGRPGPGVPGAQIPRRLRVLGYHWLGESLVQGDE